MPVEIHTPLHQYKTLLRTNFPDERSAKVLAMVAHLPEEDQVHFLSQLIPVDRIGGRKTNKPSYRFKLTDPETFLRDKYFLGLDEELYPEVIPYFVEMNSGEYTEVVLTGGIGSAKTSLAIWTQARQLYELSAMENPHEVFGLDRSTEIEFIFQSITKTLAEAVDFARFATLIKRSPYFKRWFAPDPKITSELRFPNRIIVKPVSGSNLATIGQNVVGGLIDELNYMAVVGESKKSVDKGTYDQAVALYNSISRRRKSRYYSQGKLPGILCLVSSKKYPGQFTDVKQEEAANEIAKTGKTTIYIYDKRVWDIKPHSFSDVKFKVFVGDEFRQPAIVTKVEKEDRERVIEVPEDFRTDFERDIVDALREIAGVSHLTKAPFFTSPTPLLKMFNPKLGSIFSRESVDFVTTQLEIIKRNIRNPELPRWAHVDLGLSGDSAGVTIGHCPGFVRVNRGGMNEMMPRIRLDGVLEVRPPKGAEIQFFKIRKLFYVLRDLGLNLRWVSYDTWQSVDSMQLLRQRGFIVGPISMDVDMTPYDFYKSAVYDGRVESHVHAKLLRESKDLQIDYKHQKVDHLPNGSKDVADSAAGVVYGLTIRRETWAQWGVPINEALAELVRKADKKIKGGEPGARREGGN